MKKLLLLVSIILTGFAAQAQEIKWMSMNEALEAQKKEPKKIFMDAYTTWCGPCKMLDKNTFSNKDVAAYVNENYYPVKFNAEGTEEIDYKGQTYTNPQYDSNRKGRNSQHTFATAMNVSGYPSLAYFDEEGQLLQVVAGYRTPAQLEIFLKLFGEDDYKKLTTAEAWEEYQKNFKPEFSK